MGEGVSLAEDPRRRGRRGSCLLAAILLITSIVGCRGDRREAAGTPELPQLGGATQERSSGEPARAEPAGEAKPGARAPVTITAPVELEASRRAHQAITKRQLGKRSSSIPAGLARFVPVEHAEGLEPFYEALRALERGESEDKVRVLVYGSSNVAGDRLPGYLRGYLQARFGDGGPGFVALAPLWRWHRHQEIELEASRRWQAEDIRSPELPLDGRYGLMGVRARVGPSARASIGVELRGLSPRIERGSIWYDAGPERGSFQLLAPALAEPVIVDTEAPEPRAGYASFAAEAGIEGFELRAGGDGELVLYGAVLERAGPGVVVDELGIGGSGLRRMLEWAPEPLGEHLRRRDPALVILAGGGIESMRDDHDPTRWAAELDALFERLAAAVPEAGCLLVGPHDRAPKDEQGLRRRPAILDGIIAIARDRAVAHGCAFFDSSAAMGGPGSMAAWVDAGFAMKDHVHFRPLGNAEMGRVWVDAMMAPYDARPSAP